MWIYIMISSLVLGRLGPFLSRAGTNTIFRYVREIHLCDKDDMLTLSDQK